MSSSTQGSQGTSTTVKESHLKDQSTQTNFHQCSTFTETTISEDVKDKINLTLRKKVIENEIKLLEDNIKYKIKYKIKMHRNLI